MKKLIIIIALLGFGLSTLALQSCTSSSAKEAPASNNDVTVVRSSVVTVDNTRTVVKELSYTQNGARTYDSSVYVNDQLNYSVHVVQ